MAVDRVLLEPHGGQLGEELLGQAGVDREPQPGARTLQLDELVELVADALGRHDLEAVAQCHDGLHQRGVGHEVVAGDEPGRPQHPQRIVAEALGGRQRRAQALGREVGGAVEGIDELQVGQRQRHGVDREVATRQVDGHVVGEDHVGLAGVRGVGLGPVGGDLVGRVTPLGADRAELLALGPPVIGPALEQLLDLVGPGVGGEVDVGARPLDRAGGPARRHPRGRADVRPPGSVRPGAGPRPGPVRSAGGPSALEGSGDRRPDATRGAHTSPASRHRWRAASTTWCPGPPLVGSSGWCWRPSSDASAAAVESARAWRS